MADVPRAWRDRYLGTVAVVTGTVEGMRDGLTSGGHEEFISWWFQSVRIWRAAARMSGVPLQELKANHKSSSEYIGEEE